MTASGDLLRQLFRGYSKRDDRLFRATAEEIIRNERSKNHRLLADDLERILLNGNGFSGNNLNISLDVPRDREQGFPLLDIFEYDYSWKRIIIPTRTQEMLKQIEVENIKRDILETSGLLPKQRILFYGPPGCGKTLAAQVLSSELSYPLVTIRFDSIVSSYLGETASNLRKVFEFISRGQWVVLFDEFDAIAKDRDNPFEHGELKRVVNSLLQLMDSYWGESILIAATNHEGLLDHAIWRRFDAVIPFRPPSEQDRILMLQLFLRGFDGSEINYRSVARRLEGATGSDIEWISIEVAKKAVLNHRTLIEPKDMDYQIKIFKERQKLIEDLQRAQGAESDNTQDNN